MGSGSQARIGTTFNTFWRSHGARFRLQPNSSAQKPWEVVRLPAIADDNEAAPVRGGVRAAILRPQGGRGPASRARAARNARAELQIRDQLGGLGRKLQCAGISFAVEI